MTKPLIRKNNPTPMLPRSTGSACIQSATEATGVSSGGAATTQDTSTRSFCTTTV